MLRVTDIQAKLRTLVGWRQDMNPTKRISDDLTQSDSGLYFQDANPLLTLDNIRCIRRDTPRADFPQWNAYETYKTGDIVRSDCGAFSATQFNDDFDTNQGGSKLFIAEQDGVGHDPNTSPDYWRKYDEFDEYLRTQTDIAIAAVANTFASNKTDSSSSKSLLENKCITDGAGRLNNLITPTGRLVGFEIEPVRGMGITSIINRIGLQMAGTEGSVTMYLFHTSQPHPVRTFTLDVATNGGYKWYSVPNLQMPYVSDGNNSGGQWYLCYNEADLPYGMYAVNVARDWSADPCPQCSRINIETWKSLTKYVRLSPFAVSVADEFPTNPVLPDISLIEYTPSKCYGINLELSVCCDLTDFIIMQRHEFAKCVQLQLAVNVLRAIAYNPDVCVNRNQQNIARQDVIFEVDGNSYTRSGGLMSELNKQYKTLDLDTTGLDSACLACRKSAIKIRNI